MDRLESLYIQRDRIEKWLIGISYVSYRKIIGNRLDLINSAIDRLSV